VPPNALCFLLNHRSLPVLTDAGETVRLDERAVKDHVSHPLLPAAVQYLIQIGGLLSEDVDAFVEVAVAGGLGDARVAGQAVHTATLAEPAQDQHRLAKRPQHPGAPGVPRCRRCAVSKRARYSTTWRGTSSVAT
jgi:hypothetical protein